MKHLNSYNNWQPVNEGLGIITLQLGVILGILGWKALKSLIKKAAIKIGSTLEQEPKKLKEIVDEIIAEVNKKNESGLSLVEIEKEIKLKIDSGEIKTIGQLIKYFDRA